MAAYYVDSNAGALEYSNRTWTVGDLMVVPHTNSDTNHLVSKQWIWECTTGGTSNATPTWAVSVTDDVTTLTQNGVVWTARKPDNKTHAMPGLYWLGADKTTKLATNSDVIYIADNHVSPLYAAQIQIYLVGSNSNPLRVICTNFTTDAQSSGAVEKTDNGFSYSFCGYATIVGLTLDVGNGGSSSANINSGTNDFGSQVIEFVNCYFYLNNTNTVSTISLGGNNIWANYVGIYTHCIYRFSNSSQKFVMGGGILAKNLQKHASSVSITNLANWRLDIGALNKERTFVGCDLSATNISNVEMRKAVFINCKLPTTYYSSVNYNYLYPDYTEFFGNDSDTYHYALSNYVCNIVSNTGVYKDGGYNGTDKAGSNVPLSLMMTSYSPVKIELPAFTAWIPVKITSTGSKNFSIAIAHTLASVLKDNEVWLEVEIMDDAGDTYYAEYVTAPVQSGTNIIDYTAAGSDLTDTAEAWTGITGEKTHTLSKTITVNQIGYARVRVALAKASTTIYINPDITVI